jgi:preprotein translocase subunit SecE
MARTRQKRKAKRREQQLKSTPRTAAARQQPTNPAEEAVIQAAESLEAADELEEIETGVEPEEAQATATEDLDGVSTETAEAAEPETKPARKERRPAPRQRKPAPERQKEKEPRKRGRVVNFLVQVWAELRRVQWPDRNQVTQATGVVVVFCFIAGAYLAWWDWVFTKFVTWIL